MSHLQRGDSSIHGDQCTITTSTYMHRGDGGGDGDQCTAPQVMEFSHLSEAGKGKELILP